MRRAGGRWRAGAIALGVALLAVGCRSADDGTLEGDVPDTTSTSTTTTDPTDAPTTTAPACLAVERHDVGPGVAEAEGDADGDGAPDFIQSFPTDKGDVVTLLVDLAAGGGATTEIPTDDFPVALLGAEVLDAREDDRAVLWVRVGAGASTTILGLYHLDGCSLEAATFENGEPVQLAIGGTVGTASGAACGSDIDPAADLLVYEATLISGREYEVVTTEYRWQAGQLVLSPETAPAVARSDDLAEVGGFRCGDLAL
jgi:hypothetical protein